MKEQRKDFDVTIVYDNGHEVVTVRGMIDGAAAIMEAMKLIRRKQRHWANHKPVMEVKVKNI